MDYIRVYLHTLRLKLEDDPRHPTYLETITGVGYRFRQPCIPIFWVDPIWKNLQHARLFVRICHTINYRDLSVILENSVYFSLLIGEGEG
ncbi:winged helix-turn-helix domain-containing protein [Ktedonobacter racemifer]|uniref:winged helix-turn-helix domain-containing protein n=1 Tax=Ktedonobacter racemifer TaxID=363277 RepID=UPI000948B43B|nr:helix-turn-helix domain-containing protein [Ktedonobacter racemifer]